MNSPMSALPADTALWSGLRQWVELDPTNGGTPADEALDDAPDTLDAPPALVGAGRPAG